MGLLDARYYNKCKDVPRKRRKEGSLSSSVPPSGAPIWAIKNSQFSYMF